MSKRHARPETNTRGLTSSRYDGPWNSEFSERYGQVTPAEVDGSPIAKLEMAALELLERDGVLAGLNLREVADVAGVTRGLVYHHFGTRQSLLRSALERFARNRRATVIRRGEIPGPERIRTFVPGLVDDPVSVRILALLILDGAEEFVALPYAKETRANLERDVDAGILTGDVDPDALQAGVLAAAYGWALYRKAFASSLGREASELDADVLEMVERMWQPRHSSK